MSMIPWGATIVIDASSIFREGKTWWARKNNVFCYSDWRFRVDLRRLITAVAGHRPVSHLIVFILERDEEYTESFVAAMRRRGIPITVYPCGSTHEDFAKEMWRVCHRMTPRSILVWVSPRIEHASLVTSLAKSVQRNLLLLEVWLYPPIEEHGLRPSEEAGLLKVFSLATLDKNTRFLISPFYNQLHWSVETLRCIPVARTCLLKYSMDNHVIVRDIKPTLALAATEYFKYPTMTFSTDGKLGIFCIGLVFLGCSEFVKASLCAKERLIDFAVFLCHHFRVQFIISPMTHADMDIFVSVYKMPLGVQTSSFLGEANERRDSSSSSSNSTGEEPERGIAFGRSESPSFFPASEPSVTSNGIWGSHAASTKADERVYSDL